MPKSRLGLASAQGTAATMVPRSVNGATTVMRPTLVPPTDTTALRGLAAASSSGLDPGSAVDTVTVATATALVIVVAMAIVAGTAEAAMDAGDTVAVMQSLAAASTVTRELAAVAVASTAAVVVAVVMLAVVNMVAAVTGNFHTRLKQKKMAVSFPC
jgi:hypothetical protein